MVTINNTVLSRYYSSISNSNIQRRQLMSEAILGQKHSVSVAENLIGAKLRSDTKIRIAGLNQINHGLNFINTASSILTGIKNQLEELQNQIVSLRGANKATLQSAQIMYADTMQRIAHTLKDSKFNGKSLFDGSFADTSKAYVSHCIPDDAAPFSVRYGPNTGEVISIPIPRMLPGDGRKNNPDVKDTFMPLFSVTENTYKALEDLERVRDVTEADRQVAGVVQEAWSEAQRRLITEALPEGVNAEQDIVRGLALRVFGNNISINPPSQVGTLFSKKLALSMIPAIIFFILPQQEREKIATSMIHLLAVAMPHTHDIPSATNLVQGIAHDHTVSNIQKVFQKIIKFRVTTEVNNPGGLLQHQARLAQSISLLELMKNFPRSKIDIDIYTGSLSNFKGLETANKVINNVINNIATILASFKLRKNSLEQAKAQLQTVILESSYAADNYLNTDYDKLISTLLRLNRQDRVGIIAFSLSERALNATLEQLSQAAQN